MNKEKQIEKMANIIALKAFERAHLIDGEENLADIVATDLYEKGYRKASEVAREIFEEIDEILSNINDFEADSLELEPEERYGAEVACVDLGMKFAELKKKYTEE